MQQTKENKTTNKQTKTKSRIWSLVCSIPTLTKRCGLWRSKLYRQLHFVLPPFLSKQLLQETKFSSVTLKGHIPGLWLVDLASFCRFIVATTTVGVEPQRSCAIEQRGQGDWWLHNHLHHLLSAELTPKLD